MQTIMERNVECKMEKEKTENEEVLTLKILCEKQETAFKFVTEISQKLSIELLDTCHILKNKDEPGYHMFVKIKFLKPTDIKKERNFDFKTTKPSRGDTE